MNRQYKKRKTKYMVWTLAAAFWLLSTPAAGDEQAGWFFLHRLHKEEIDCMDCHQRNDKTGRQRLPSAESCRECHEDGIEYQAPTDSARPSFTYLRFSHSVHQDQDCTACHLIQDNGHLKKQQFEDCIRCHAVNEISLICKDCHGNRFQPDYHQGSFRRRHGKKSRATSSPAAHGRDCKACHGEPACRGCHRRIQPGSHTGFFKLRGHGLKAAIDGQSCRTCHRESFCIQCHRKTRPQNHRTNWKYTHGFADPQGLSGSLGKCGICHTPVWCATCHNG